MYNFHQALVCEKPNKTEHGVLHKSSEKCKFKILKNFQKKKS
jgi:hypothetical protein